MPSLLQGWHLFVNSLTMNNIQLLKINPADNVAVAIEALAKGQQVVVDGKTITVAEAIPAGHKLALKAFKPGEHAALNNWESNMQIPDG